MIRFILPAARFSPLNIAMLAALFAKIAAGLAYTDENDLMMLAHEMVRLIGIVGMEPDLIQAEVQRLFPIPLN